ncbi:MAG: hypothetical protein M0D53_01820 [Flavobacterium sp. JAD_PAG50586_2]|nr:MAG: hypothetical protein M0D53_01820 [Flavobacterium sp. JAD_PAG50586_2]
MKSKICLFFMFCFLAGIKIKAQSFKYNDSCTLHDLVKNPDNLKMQYLMDCADVSKQFKVIKTVENKSTKTAQYSSVYENFEINYDNKSIWLKYKNEKATLNFNSKFKHKLVGIKKKNQIISFIVQTEFDSSCKIYISFDFHYSKDKKLQFIRFTQFDFVNGR